MRNRFDQLAKQIGQAALDRSGTTIVNDEINPETQQADLRHEPDPARLAERDRLGLLGRLAAVRCLIEIYSHAPDAEEFRACLAKHLALWQQHARQRRSDQRSDEVADSFLWIIAAGSPTTLLTNLKFERAEGWPAGVYLFGGDVLRVGIVVASELPRERPTLLVRLMAAGPLLKQTLREIAALPETAHERAVAKPVLLKLRHDVGQQSSPTPEEQEFIVAMEQTWEERQAELRAEGRAETTANAILSVLRARSIAVPENARKRILAVRDLEQLETWLERASVASSLADVLTDAS